MADLVADRLDDAAAIGSVASAQNSTQLTTMSRAWWSPNNS
jgi:hypothetical protein